MSRIPLRHWYPSMVMEEATIDTKSFGKVFVGRWLQYRIQKSNRKLRRG